MKMSKKKTNGIAEQNISHYAKGLNDGYDKAKKEVFDDINKFIKVGNKKECFGSIVNRLKELKKKHLKKTK